jgi:hypothetical protein
MITGENNGLRLCDLGHRLTLPSRHKDSEFLKTAQRSGGLGQGILPRARRLIGVLVRGWQILHKFCQIRQISQGKSNMGHSE